MIVRSIAGGVEALAPAKLNLFLEVLGRRPDGYHEIETVMVAVSLYDTLTFTDDPSGAISLRCSDPALPVGSDNLVVLAAERLRALAGCHRGARIVLDKTIPKEAGRHPPSSLPWRGRSAATWLSSRMLRPRFVAGGVSESSRSP
jgi:4-diphosphocytidyl-2-C-methyl-D-erythritol kinase